MIFVERFWKSLAKAGGCDVDVVIELDEHTVKFPCHRHILNKVSGIFKKELSNKPDHIVITKVEPHVMFLMLCYIYGEKFDPIDWKTTVAVFLAAESFEITSLHEHCIQLLLGFLDLSNACSLLELASTRSIPELYAASIEICVNGAFHVLDSDDFDNVRPSTVISIVSHPKINVPNETYVLYVLWIRATIDACRSSEELTYRNISKYFEPYSMFVQFEDIDQKEVAKYNNEYLMRYCVENTTSNTRIYPVKRGMKFPLKLPSNLYVGYNSGDIVAMGILRSRAYVGFEAKESAYLIEFRMACCYKANISHHGITNMAVFENGNLLLEWNVAENNNNSKLGLKVCERMAYTAQGDVPFQEFRFVLKDLVKLCRVKTYRIEIDSASTGLIWPVFKNKLALSDSITIQNDTYQSLTQMKLLPCPAANSC